MNKKDGMKRKKPSDKTTETPKKYEGNLLVGLILIGTFIYYGLLPIAWSNTIEGGTQLQDERIAVFGSSWSQEPYPTHLSLILDREVVGFMYGGTGSGGALEVCNIYNEPQNKFGIIVVDFGSYDVYIGTPWNVTDNNLRELFRSLKNTGAIVVFNQLVPDTYQGFGPVYDYCTFSKLVVEEEVILVPNMSEGIGAPSAMNPYFMGDPLHPNDVGYCLLAERTAKVLRDTGLVEWADTWDNLSTDATDLLTKTQDLITQLEAKEGDITHAEWIFNLSQYLYNEEQYYTLKWQIEKELISPLTTVLDHWDEVQTLFTQAQQAIRTLEEQNTSTSWDIQLSNADYRKAETYWIQYSYDDTQISLQRIITRVPEHLLTTLLVITLLLLPRSRNTIS